MKIGAPHEIVSDRGRQFESKIFQSLLERYAVRWRPTAAYHPQSNPTEAANKTIGNAIRAYIASDRHHNEWDAWLAEIACAVNTACHTTTRMTPFEIVFGTKMRLIAEPPIERADESIAERMHRIQTRRDAVGQNILKARSTARVAYNLRTRDRSHAIDERVVPQHEAIQQAQ